MHNRKPPLIMMHVQAGISAYESLHDICLAVACLLSSDFTGLLDATALLNGKILKEVISTPTHTDSRSLVLSHQWALWLDP